jgi:hypothetical protein
MSSQKELVLASLLKVPVLSADRPQKWSTPREAVRS